MRANTPAYAQFNASPAKAQRTVVKLLYPTPVYLTSSAETHGITGTVIPDCVLSASGTSQELKPLEGRSIRGSLSFQILDAGGAVSALFRDQEAAGNGLRGTRVQLYTGGAGMDFADFRLEQTQQCDGAVQFSEGVYKIQSQDILYSLRSDLFAIRTTRLAADFLIGDTSLQVFDASDLEPCPHRDSNTDQPSGDWYYLKIRYRDAFEIVSSNTKVGNTFTGCNRGLFGTTPIDHVLPDDASAENSIEVEEFVYLELPAPAMAYALLTGELGADTLPSNWHLAIDPADVDKDSFDNIGSDWFDPADYGKGLTFRFDGLTREDGKRFIEKEIMLLAGAFLRVGPDGRLGMRRLPAITRDADYHVRIGLAQGLDNIVSHGTLKHDQAAIRNLFEIQWAYLQFPGQDRPKYFRTTRLVDSDSVALYKTIQPLKLAFRGLHNARHTRSTLLSRFDALRDMYSGAPLTITVDLLPSLNNAEVGDVARLVLDDVNDYQGEGTLDRSFLVTKVTVDQESGRVTLSLFGSARRAEPLIDDGGQGAAELPDGWYDAEGDQLAAESGVSIVAGELAADATVVAGAGTTSDVFYHLNNLTIPAGVTLTIEGSAWLRIRGNLQIDGTLVVTDGAPANAAGFLGTTFGGRIRLIGDGATPVLDALAAQRVEGQNNVFPPLEIVNNAGTLEGVPGTLRGSGGGNGGAVLEYNDTDNVWEVGALGGGGGVGGGSLIVTARGVSFGVAGKIVLSGTDGSVGSTYQSLPSGSGGGGAPGGALLLIDGALSNRPILSDGRIEARYGLSPALGGDATTQGKATAILDLSTAAARVMYVPVSRKPYPEYSAPVTQTGQDGLSVFAGTVLQRSATVPASPSGGSYNFGTRTLTPPAGWSVAVPAGSDPLYASTAIFEVQGVTGVDDTATWSAPGVLASDGSSNDGADGRSVYVATIYRRRFAPPNTPTGGGYNFGTQTLTVPGNWFAEPPPGNEPLYATTSPFSVLGNTGIDNSPAWTTPQVLVSDPVTGDITPSSVVVTDDGSGPNLAAAAGSWAVFIGTTDVTADAVFAIEATPGISGTIDAAGVFSVTALSGGSGQLVMTATYNGVTVRKLFNVTAIVAPPTASATLPGGPIDVVIPNGSGIAVGSRTVQTVNIDNPVFLWERVSGDNNTTVADATAQTGSFRSTGFNDVLTDVWVCRVTADGGAGEIYYTPGQRVTARHGTPSA